MRRLRLLFLAVPLLLTLSVAPAQAGLGSWTSMPGLTAPGSSWVREYATAHPPDDDLRRNGGRRRLPLGQRRPHVGVVQQRPGGVSGRDERAHGVHQRALDGLRGHQRRPVQVRRRRALAAGGAGSGGRPEAARRSSTTPCRPSSRPARRRDARRRRQRRRLPQHRRRRDLDAAGPGQRDGALGDRLEHRLAIPDGVIFAATGSGIYRSIDFGSTWTLASDGISGTTLRVFADGKNPNIYYAAGPARRLPLDQRRHHVVGDQRHRVAPARQRHRARAARSSRGVNETRLYVGTDERHLRRHDRPRPDPRRGQLAQGDQQRPAAGHNTILWALTSFINTPGTLLAGTQSNGGYALTFIAAVRTRRSRRRSRHRRRRRARRSRPTTTASWTGTQTIEFEYQWQAAPARPAPTSTTRRADLRRVPEHGDKYRFRVDRHGSTTSRPSASRRPRARSRAPHGATPARCPGATSPRPPRSSSRRPGRLLAAAVRRHAARAELAVQPRGRHRQLPVVPLRLRRRRLRHRRGRHRSELPAHRRRRHARLCVEGHRHQRRR